MAEHPGTAHGDVELNVPAESAFVAIVRTITAGLAARCDLTLDEIEDLRIAVDEACALLLPHAVAETSLATRFTLRHGRLDFRASVVAKAGARPDRGGFAWSVLRALADDLEVASDETALSIAFSKLRAVPVQSAQ